MPIQILEGIVGRSIIWNAILGFFATLDRIAFTIFGWIMQAIFDIANTEIISQSVFDEFRTRIYVLLGIFMLFKVTVSLLTYLVNPDKMTDKESGMGKIVTRTIIVICMLVGMPFVFSLLDEAQPIILEALPRIVIGKDTASNIDNSNQSLSTGVVDQAKGMADSISWTTFQLSLNQSSVAALEADGINTVEGATKNITTPDPNDNSVYKYFYIPVIGTVLALIMGFLMVGFAIDVAIRAFKLVILKMIAPIPIISYIDPKSAKDGAFSNWVKSFTSTWLELFIRLGIIYFVLFMIDVVILQGGIKIGSGEGEFWFRTAVVTVFLIIGLFFFAKQAPKFISDALGIKSSKGLGIGLGGMLAAGGALVGGAGLTGALVAGTEAMGENAEATAQGKAATASWSKGREKAAQLRTGDKNAKGGIFNGIKQRLNDNASDRMANRYGLSMDNIKDLKNNSMKEQQNLIDAQNALQEYETGVQSGKYEYNADTMKALQHNVGVASNRSRDAQKVFDEAKAARETFVRKPSQIDGYRARPNHITNLNTPGGRTGYEKAAVTSEEYTNSINAKASKIDAYNYHSVPEFSEDSEPKIDPTSNERQVTASGIILNPNNEDFENAKKINKNK